MCGLSSGFSQTSLAIHQQVRQQPTAKAATSSSIPQGGKAPSAPGKGIGGLHGLRAGDAVVRDAEEGFLPRPQHSAQPQQVGRAQSCPLGWLGSSSLPCPSPSRWLTGKLRWQQEKGWLLCSTKVILPPQLDLEAPSSRMWLQTLLLASPRAGLEPPGAPAAP